MTCRSRASASLSSPLHEDKRTRQSCTSRTHAAALTTNVHTLTVHLKHSQLESTSLSTNIMHDTRGNQKSNNYNFKKIHIDLKKNENVLTNLIIF